jgi:CubicO group peptidase (beta-lactamase class C family)
MSLNDVSVTESGKAKRRRLLFLAKTLGWLVLAGLLGGGVWLQAERLEESESLEPQSEQRETTWEQAAPREVGMDEPSLRSMAERVGGSGVVVREGKLVYRWGHAHRPRYAASVKKSLISVLNWRAVEQGLLKSIDDPVVDVEPRLRGLNGGRDAAMTWRHLACMTSGYGLVEGPGESFAYNDYAVALWYDSLMNGVYREDGTTVLRRQLAEPLEFEDAVTFKAMGEDGPEPKLRISARDLARVGQMLLQKGSFRGKRLFSEAHWQVMVSSVVPVEMPLSSGKLAAMLPDARTVGGQLNISPIGPGRYTFHLWRNRKGPSGNLMLPDAPTDTLLASGKWGEVALWIIPSLNLVVAWNDSKIDDHHLARHEPEAEMNLVARLIMQSTRSAGE